MNPDPPPSALRLFVINVQGLSSSKFPAILRWLREKAAHGAILTETHVTSDPFDLLKVTAGGGTNWPGIFFFFFTSMGNPRENPRDKGQRDKGTTVTAAPTNANSRGLSQQDPSACCQRRTPGIPSPESLSEWERPSRRGSTEKNQQRGN